MSLTLWWRVGATLLALTYVAGCGPPANVAAKEPPIPTVKTSAEWNLALEKSYSRSSIKDDEDGNTAFLTSCPSGGPKNCDGNNGFYDGLRDNFGKFTIFRDPMYLGNSYSDRVTVGLNVILPDCMTPFVIIRPTYFSKERWLFINSLSILKDGKFLFEYKLERNDVSRNVLPGGVEEIGTFAIFGAGPELDALRQVGTGKILVRLSGEKGDALLSARATRNFTAEVASALGAFDRLSTVLAPVTPASCP